jgi:release factor glutamine methyltransferase
MNIRNLIMQGNAALNDRVDSPFLDARLLLGHVLGISLTRLFLRMDDLVDKDTEERFWAVLNRRLGGECIAYITGYKEFWSLRFRVNRSVLVPRADTETLVEAALGFIERGRVETVLELCTGSGAVGISLKLEKLFLAVTMSDVSQDALAVARENARELQADAVFIQSDLFESIDGRFDMIMANPPYVPTGALESLPLEVRNEPRLALDGGEDGLDLIRRIVEDALTYLNRGGVLLMEADPDQMRKIREIAAQYKETWTVRDLTGAERVIACVKD